MQLIQDKENIKEVLSLSFFHETFPIHILYQQRINLN